MDRCNAIEAQETKPHFFVVVVNSTVELTFSYCVSYHRSNWFAIAFGRVLCRSISLSIAGFRPAIFLFFFPEERL